MPTKTEPQTTEESILDYIAPDGHEGRVYAAGPTGPALDRDIAYYLYEVGYEVNVVIRTYCTTCNGMGKIPYANDINKKAWAQRMKPCPNHAEESVRDYDYPSEEYLRSLLPAPKRVVLCSTCNQAFDLNEEDSCGNPACALNQKAKVN